MQRANLDALLDDLRFDDLTAGLSPVDREVAAINRRFDALRQQAIDLGASQEDLELIERRRTAAIREATAATEESTEAITDYIAGIVSAGELAIGQQQVEAALINDIGRALESVRQFLSRGASVSSANPLQRLTEAQAAFEDLVRRSAEGDVAAIGQVAGGADRLLQQAAAFYGVGSAEFQEYERLVRGTLTPLANTNTDTQVLPQVLGQLRLSLDALLRFLQGGNAAGGVLPASVLLSIDNSLKAMSREKARAY